MAPFETGSPQPMALPRSWFEAAELSAIGSPSVSSALRGLRQPFQATECDTRALLSPRIQPTSSGRWPWRFLRLFRRVACRSVTLWRAVLLRMNLRALLRAVLRLRALSLPIAEFLLLFLLCLLLVFRLDRRSQLHWRLELAHILILALVLTASLRPRLLVRLLSIALALPGCRWVERRRSLVLASSLLRGLLVRLAGIAALHLRSWLCGWRVLSGRNRSLMLNGNAVGYDASAECSGGRL